jgi:hypothetical protein
MPQKIDEDELWNICKKFDPKTIGVMAGVVFVGFGVMCLELYLRWG